MSDHLPECPDTVQCVYDQNGQCWLEHSQCICEELHACEQRTWDEAYACGFNAGRDHGEKVGRAAGLDAAKAAVAELTDKGDSVRPADVMAAIDALRGVS